MTTLQHDPRFLIPGWAFGPESVRPLATQLGAELLSVPGLCEPVAWVGHVQGISPWAAGLIARLSVAPARVTIVGWSLGAMIALEAAMACPDRIGRLVLVAGTARFVADAEDVPGVPERNVRAMIAGLKRNRAATLQRFYQDCYRPVDLLEVSGMRLEQLSQDWPDEALRTGLEYLRHADLRPGLGALNVPVLLIHGNEDAVIPIAAGEALARTLPRAELCMLPNAGHALPVLDPDRVVGAALPFLERT